MLRRWKRVVFVSFGKCSWNFRRPYEMLSELRRRRIKPGACYCGLLLFGALHRAFQCSMALPMQAAAQPAPAAPEPDRMTDDAIRAELTSLGVDPRRLKRRESLITKLRGARAAAAAAAASAPVVAGAAAMIAGANGALAGAAPQDVVGQPLGPRALAREDPPARVAPSSDGAMAMAGAQASAPAGGQPGVASGDQIERAVLAYLQRAAATHTAATPAAAAPVAAGTVAFAPTMATPAAAMGAPAPPSLAVQGAGQAPVGYVGAHHVDHLYDMIASLQQERESARRDAQVLTDAAAKAALKYPDPTLLTSPRVAAASGLDRVHLMEYHDMVLLARELVVLASTTATLPEAERGSRLTKAAEMADKIVRLMVTAIQAGPDVAFHLDRNVTDHSKALKDAKSEVKRLRKEEPGAGTGAGKRLRSVQGACYKCNSSNHLARDCPMGGGGGAGSAPKRGRAQSGGGGGGGGSA